MRNRNACLLFAFVLTCSAFLGVGAGAESFPARGPAGAAWATEPGAAGVAEIRAAESGVAEQAPTSPWAACGTNTDPNKVVRLFVKSRVVDYVLRCGGPKYSSNPTWGYRHILKNHRSQFQQLAFGTGQNWRDVADLGMDSNTSDPDASKSVGNGKICYSRLIYLIDKNTGQVVREQVIRMIVAANGNIITSYPSRHC